MPSDRVPAKAGTAKGPRSGPGVSWVPPSAPVSSPSLFVSCRISVESPCPSFFCSSKIESRPLCFSARGFFRHEQVFQACGLKLLIPPPPFAIAQLSCSSLALVLMLHAACAWRSLRIFSQASLHNKVNGRHGGANTNHQFVRQTEHHK